jgi:hypothetical protein
VTRETVSFASERWRWSGGTPERTSYLGRDCVRVGTTTATLADVELEDGVIELQLAVGPERGFHGVVWRVRDDENYESFFVRPHQVGNPDAIQYTPVFNGWAASRSTTARATGPTRRFRSAIGSGSGSRSRGRTRRSTSPTWTSRRSSSPS